MVASMLEERWTRGGGGWNGLTLHPPSTENNEENGGLMKICDSNGRL
jgi:hypothetical protein